LFDDPLRKQVAESGKGKEEDSLFDFTKSKKGLGDLYEEDYRKKLLSSGEHEYKDDSLNGGIDTSLKKEISELQRSLFHQLDQLSNFNFTP